ncbi:MAG: ankyrin repeat domain-containing protein [Candidatus Babeliales bacterium]
MIKNNKLYMILLSFFAVCSVGAMEIVQDFSLVVQEFQEATAQGDRRKVISFLQNKSIEEKKTLVETTDNKGFTPLMLAARNGHQNIIENILIDIHNNEYLNSLEYINRKAQTKDPSRQVSALWLAAEFGHAHIVHTLLLSGANPNEKKIGIPLLNFLIVKALNGNLSSLYNFLNAEKIDPNIQDMYGNTPLITAIQSVANINSDLFTGEEPIEKIVKLLMEKNVNRWIKNNAKQTASDIAREKKLDKIIEILEAKAIRKFLSAAAQGNLEEIKKLFQKENKKMFVNAIDEEGRNSLMLAARNGHNDVVEFILNDIQSCGYVDLKEYVNRKSKHWIPSKNVSALFRARYYNHPDVVKSLQNYGADSDDQDLTEASGTDEINQFFDFMKKDFRELLKKE